MTIHLATPADTECPCPREACGGVDTNRITPGCPVPPAAPDDTGLFGNVHIGGSPACHA